MTLKRFIIIFVLFLLIAYSGINYFIGSERLTTVKNLIPNEIKIFLKQNLFFKKYQNELTSIIDKKNTKIQSIKSSLVEGKKIFFENNNEFKFLNVLGQEYKLNKYSTFQLQTSKHPGSRGNSYLDLFDGNLFIVSADGIISFIDKSDLYSQKKEITGQILKSNIKEIIKFDLFYQDSQFGIKDILIHNNKLFLSYTNKLKEDCYNTAILYSEINLNYLEFKDFFVPEQCISKRKVDEFNAHQSGGRLVSYNKDYLLFSIGEYRDRIKAQDINSIFGKIIKINVENKKYEVISLGHRNVQGLYYNSDLNLLISSEHGPKGGDEININYLNESKIKNFGWPISSYGEHYKNDEKLYKKFPLHKSHANHGFEEPLIYFVPSIGISQVVQIPKKFFNNQFITIVYGSMGNNPSEGDMSLYFAIIENDKLIKNLKFNFEERIRDIIYDYEENSILLFLESSSSLGVLKKSP